MGCPVTILYGLKTNYFVITRLDADQQLCKNMVGTNFSHLMKGGGGNNTQALLFCFQLKKTPSPFAQSQTREQFWLISYLQRGDSDCVVYSVVDTAKKRGATALVQTQHYCSVFTQNLQEENICSHKIVGFLLCCCSSSRVIFFSRKSERGKKKLLAFKRPYHADVYMPPSPSSSLKTECRVHIYTLHKKAGKKSYMFVDFFLLKKEACMLKHGQTI